MPERPPSDIKTSDGVVLLPDGVMEPPLLVLELPLVPLFVVIVLLPLLLMPVLAAKVVLDEMIELPGKTRVVLESGPSDVLVTVVILSEVVVVEYVPERPPPDIFTSKDPVLLL